MMTIDSSLDDQNGLQLMVLSKTNNQHIAVDELALLLAEELERIGCHFGCRIGLESLGKPKTGADNPTMALVRTTAGQPKAIISCSRPAYPELIMRGVKASEEIRALIGEKLGSTIIRPIKSGYIDGRSYVILPWYRKLSTWKPFYRFQRLALRHRLLRWLNEATMAAATEHGKSVETDRSFMAMLNHLAQQSFIDTEKRAAIEKAAYRLDAGIWQPVHTFDHNDLWMDNVMLPASISQAIKQRYAFVLIDWAGANQYGYGIFDLIRLGRSLNLPIASLRRELLLHTSALRCNPEDARGHLLAALGRLHQNLECFPEEKFIETLQSCWNTINKALPETEVG